MSEYYDHYHRWEPLAEFHFNLNENDDEEYDDENYIYCLCSRAYIRDGVKAYNADKEDGSESDMEVLRDTGSQSWENESHVHFSLDTSYKVKCEKDEGASCYCSASHTDNCCSTDEHDAAQIHGTSHGLHPSDSGADLTYQDCHSENTNPDKLERMDHDSTENYLSEATWDKFWAVNGERLIWASWIMKYSDYINPAYLNENNDLIVDDNNIPKQKSVDQIFKESDCKNEDDSMRERKFSYDSKVNPYKKGHGQNQQEKLEKIENKDESWMPYSRRRSCSEHERIVSPRTLAATDSMTNVTKITLSSYDVTSSHVTSESSPTDDYSVSSTSSDDQSNDQTRIANLENADPNSTDDMDSDQYWQFLWKKHFGEQFALHYANYLVRHIAQENDLPSLKIEASSPKEENAKQTILETRDKILDIECENSDGNSQELPTVIEIQTEEERLNTEVERINSQVEKLNTNAEDTLVTKTNIQVEEINTQVEVIKLENLEGKPKKRGNIKSNKYLSSVGVLLQNLIKDEPVKDPEVTEAGEDNSDKKDSEVKTETVVDNNENSTNIRQPGSNTNFTSYSYDDGDDEPPEETPINLKRSHEMDHEEVAAEKIKATFEIMGFSIEDNNIPKGQMVFSKKLARLRPPQYKNSKRFGTSRKTYFDEDGSPILEVSQVSQDEIGMHIDDGLPCPGFRSEALRLLSTLDTNPETTLFETDKDQNQITNKAKNLANEPENNVAETHSIKNETNINVGKTVTVNKPGIEISTDDLQNITASSNKSAIFNVSEDMSTEVDSNESVNSDKMNKKAFDNESSLKDNTKNIPKPKGIVESICIETADTKYVGSLVKKKDNLRVYNNYDVQNKVDNIDTDESRAVEASEVPLPDDMDPFSDEKQETLENSVSQSVESSKRRRRQKRYAKLDGEELSGIPEELRDDPKMLKYWKKRHSLFHRFDKGIRLDRESWFSVTPENVARHIARKYTYDTVLDAFCGAGGNTIQFAFASKKVIAIDIDPNKVDMARHNATVYGVANRIQFIVGDFFELAPTLQADMVFLSPPWGGPDYSNNAQYDIETMLEPRPASELMSVARTISPNISFYLPRNTRPDQILSLTRDVGGSVEVEQSYLGKRFVAITAYFY